MVNSVTVKEFLSDVESAKAALFPILQAGAVSGSAGLVAGSIWGTLKSPNPAIFASAIAVESFAAGSAFWFIRNGICKAWLIEPSSPPSDRVKASATAGGITGIFAGGFLRGPSKIIPATLLFTAFGYVGQKGYNALDARHTRQSEDARTEGSVEKKSLWRRMADSKYSPMKVLSDEEYEKVLREKLVRIDAEIALVDEDIKKMELQAVQQESEQNTAR